MKMPYSNKTNAKNFKRTFHQHTQVMTFQKLLIPFVILTLLGGAFYFLSGDAAEKQEDNLSAIVQQGEFRIFVNASGELKAKNSVKIKGPGGMRPAGIYNTTITDMVPEGTVVKEGEYVAALDKTELSTKTKEAQNELDKIQTQLEQAKIDTAIDLRAIRNELINLTFGMEEKKLQVEQSKYEPQMVIQQAEIDLQKTKRDFGQLGQKYELSQTKSIAMISEIMASLRTEQLILNRLNDLSKEFTIMAPKGGMVIYSRSWNGKVAAGSQISSWNPTVAELPDLDDMISKTFVNEVDISKIKEGQDVKIKVDAFPDNEYTGSVINVANIGEQLKGYDSKVFEITVQLNEVDSILRPAMTTSNEVLTYTFEDVIFVPLEAIYNDSLTFVYKNDNGTTVKQEVIVGESNDNQVIIEHGLKKGDEFYFTPPSNAGDLSFYPVDPAIKDAIRKKIAEAKARRKAEADAKAKTTKDFVPDNESSGGMIFFN